MKKNNLPIIGLLYLDYVLKFFNKSNFKSWPEKIEEVTYHWKNDKNRFIKEIKRKKIDILIGNIPATAYDVFVEISKELPHVRFVPSLETQFSNKSKENVTVFCKKNNLSIPKTEIFYEKEEALNYLSIHASYPQIIKKSYGPSNYGGYYVHKVDNFKEAKNLLQNKKYNPIYTQNAIVLKNSGDLRIMLIGHKPVCAFWRFSAKGQWITNTSQGGEMSYTNVPLNALELAVKASKAAKAEYWACDIAIDEKHNKAYILECATAFAAFPYIRDWICQYLMWDFSHGKFIKPNIPLYSWEELGKISPNILRTLRNITFGQTEFSSDAEKYIQKEEELFLMHKTKNGEVWNIPTSINIETLPIYNDLIKKTENRNFIEIQKIDLNNTCLTQLLSLPEIKEELALELYEFTKENIITDVSDLLELEEIDDDMLFVWEENFKDLRFDINQSNISALIKIKGIGPKLAENILSKKEKIGRFESFEDLKDVEGIGINKFNQLKVRLKIGE